MRAVPRLKLLMPHKPLALYENRNDEICLEHRILVVVVVLDAVFRQVHQKAQR